jgi:hypothetical protein
LHVVAAAAATHGHTRSRAQNGWTALICAATNGHADCVRLLLDAGADKEAKDSVRASAVFVYGALFFGQMLVIDSFAR